MLSKTDRDYGTPPKIPPSWLRWKSTAAKSRCPRALRCCARRRSPDVAIPKLCATDSLEPFGSCRLCLVQVEGRNGYPASCTTPVEAGMKVRTQMPRCWRELRRGVMELYMSDHPLDCLTCAGNGNCELQDDGRRGGAARGALRLRGQESSERREGRFQSVFHLRSRAMHRVLALRARVRGGAGHLRADHRRAAASIRWSRRASISRSSNPNAFRAAPACRPARPTR